jgi:hypothetical protein
VQKDLRERIDYLEKIVPKINTMNLDALRRLNWLLAKYTFKQSVLEFELKNYKESEYLIKSAKKYFDRSYE